MEGHIYTVCAGSDYANSKCGFTTQDVWPYLQNNYARTMIPLTIRKVMQVPNARLAESMLFCAMDSYRKVANHEVFDIDDETLTQSYDSVNLFFDSLTAGNPSLAQCVFVQPPAPSRTRNTSGLSVHQLAKQAAKERREQRLRAFNSRIQQEQEKSAKIENLPSFFISTCCTVGTGLKVSTEKFRHAFNDFSGESLSCYDLVPIMKARDFIKKLTRFDGDLVQGFWGLALK